MQEIVRQHKDGVSLAVHVVPRSARSKVIGVRGQAVRVRLKGPPVRGAANAALIALLADTLGVPSHAVEIISGRTSRRKIVSVAGLSVEAAQRWLESLPADA